MIHIPCDESLILEQRALVLKGNMFEDIFGMPVRLEEA